MTDKFRIGEMAILRAGDGAWPEYDNAPVIITEPQAVREGWCERTGWWRKLVYCVRCFDGMDFCPTERELRKLRDSGETQSTQRELELELVT